MNNQYIQSVRADGPGILLEEKIWLVRDEERSPRKQINVFRNKNMKR